MSGLLDPSTYLGDEARAAKKFRGEHGYHETDAWSFDTYLAGVIAGGCRVLIDKNHGHPARLKNAAEWEAILEKIATGFELYVKNDDVQQPEVREALDLFREWFADLWD
jgi:hypothetical protein